MTENIGWLKRLQCLLITLLVALNVVLISACKASEDNSDLLVVAVSDFVYLGAFAPPQQAISTVEGTKWSTAYASGGLALRYVVGEKRFFATTHIYSGGLVYEMSFPGLELSENYPMADIVREWGDIYQGRKITQDSQELGGDVWTHGLFWDDAEKHLYWSYGHAYNVAQVNHPVLGYTKFSGDVVEAAGPWQSAEGSAHSQRIRGGVLRVPDWFAERYTGGKTLGIGFGGYWSGVVNASQGPTLYASTEPDGPQGILQTQALITFSEGDCNMIDTENVRPCKAIRDNGYSRSATQPVAWDVDPIDDQGYWTAADSIEGAVWIDTADRHGLIFFATLGQGEICYCDGAVRAEDYASYWYIYDPQDLADVAQGKLEPWQLSPSSMNKISYPAGVRVTGAVFDDQDRVLYLYVYEAYQEGFESYPLIYAYRLQDRSR